MKLYILRHHLIIVGCHRICREEHFAASFRPLSTATLADASIFFNNRSTLRSADVTRADVTRALKDIIRF